MNGVLELGNEDFAGTVASGVTLVDFWGGRSLTRWPAK